MYKSIIKFLGKFCPPVPKLGQDDYGKVEKKVEIMDKEIESVKKHISRQSRRTVVKLSHFQRQLKDLEAIIVKN